MIVTSNTKIREFLSVKYKERFGDQTTEICCEPVYNDESYRKMADIAIKLGIKPGYYWKLVDKPHFEI
jgi:hypothetical protein